MAPRGNEGLPPNRESVQMSLLPPRIAGSIAVMTLLLQLACASQRIGIVPNDYSQARSAEVQASDLARCDEVAEEVHREYGPFPTGTTFSDASRNFAYHTRYQAACMRAKGYEVVGSFGRAIEPIDLPDAAVSTIRDLEGSPK
jgi:hypothetical protein